MFYNLFYLTTVGTTTLARLATSLTRLAHGGHVVTTHVATRLAHGGHVIAAGLTILTILATSFAVTTSIGHSDSYTL